MSERPKTKLDELDEKVDDIRVEVAVLGTRLKIGFAVIGLLLASPQLGGPTAHQAIAGVLHALL